MSSCSIFDCQFVQKGDLSISFSPHRLCYNTIVQRETRETTIDCLMVSSILDADIAATIKRGDLLISLKTRNEEIPFINNPSCTFDHALHILSQSNTQSNRTFRFLRPPHGCTQDYTTYLYDVLDANTAVLIYDSNAETVDTLQTNYSPSLLPSSPSSSLSSVNSNGLLRSVPLSQPTLPPKVEVKALRVKSKAIAEQEERLEQMRAAATIDDEVQKRIEAKNREVVSELLRVREEAKQAEMEAKRLAQEMRELAEAKKRRGMEMARQERENLALETARRQLAEEEAVARQAIAERQERARREVEEREAQLLERKAQEEQVYREQEERKRRDLEERNRLEEERSRRDEDRRLQEDRIARMLEEHTKQMTMAMEKAYIEIENAKREASEKAQLDLAETQAALEKATEGQRRAQEELKTMEEERRALEEATRLRLRVEEEAKLIEAATATAKAEATRLLTEEREVARLLAEQRETARLLAEERYKIEEDAMKLLQAKRLAAAELDLLKEERLKTELENRKLSEVKQVLATEVLRYEEQRRVHELNKNALQYELTVKKDSESKLALTAELEVAKETARRAENDANRVAEALRAMELREAQQAVQETARRAENEANRVAEVLRAMELREAQAQQAVQEATRRAENEANRVAEALRAMELREAQAQQAVQASLARQAELEEARRVSLALLEKESALCTMATTSLPLFPSKGLSPASGLVYPPPHLSHSLLPTHSATFHGDDDNDRVGSNVDSVVSKSKNFNSDSNNNNNSSSENNSERNHNHKRVEDLKAELLRVQHELHRAESGLGQQQRIRVISKANQQQGVSVPADRHKQRIENESVRQQRIDMVVRARVDAQTKKILQNHEENQNQQSNHDTVNDSSTPRHHARESRASSTASTSTTIVSTSASVRSGSSSNIDSRLKKLTEIASTDLISGAIFDKMTALSSNSSSSNTNENFEKYERESTKATESMQNEAHRLSLKVKEVNMRRKRLMAEGEKLKMIALSAQLSLEQVEQQQQQQQQMDRNTTVDIKSWSTEDHNHTSDEQKRHIPR